MLKNQTDRYGAVQIGLHWLIAMAVFGLFGLGLWMVELDYYSSWYRTAPDIHRSIGVIVVSLMVLRLVWRLANPAVVPLSSHKKWEVSLAKVTQRLLYLIIILLGASGYMVTTASGQPLMVFDWFAIPALNFSVEYQEDLAGDMHEILAWSLIGLVGLHAIGALKHHFMDKDVTLKRMLNLK